MGTASSSGRSGSCGLSWEPSASTSVCTGSSSPPHGCQRRSASSSEMSRSPSSKRDSAVSRYCGSSTATCAPKDDRTPIPAIEAAIAINATTTMTRRGTRPSTGLTTSAPTETVTARPRRSGSPGPDHRRETERRPGMWRRCSERSSQRASTGTDRQGDGRPGPSGLALYDVAEVGFGGPADEGAEQTGVGQGVDGFGLGDRFDGQGEVGAGRLGDGGGHGAEGVAAPGADVDGRGSADEVDHRLDRLADVGEVAGPVGGTEDPERAALAGGLQPEGEGHVGALALADHGERADQGDGAALAEALQAGLALGVAAGRAEAVGFAAGAAVARTAVHGAGGGDEERDVSGGGGQDAGAGDHVVAVAVPGDVGALLADAGAAGQVEDGCGAVEGGADQLVVVEEIRREHGETRAGPLRPAVDADDPRATGE